ncbi:WD40 repeat domain-containing protein [Fuerstiella marisgermanici]|uniref:Uncharacterized protein n=1 Tax=Fuerstiella marisgermanici TaxID=1891926 RepID=A0A1P8WRE9_9PLAN|nr:putative protein containing caspase domain protein [Fuerstiella marisgermanici]
MILQLVASLLVIIQASAQPQILDGHSHSVWHVQFSPDKSSLVSASSTSEGEEPEICNWNMATLTVRWKVRPFEQWVFDVHFDSNGNYVLATDRQNSVKQWEISTGKLRNEIRVQEIQTVRYSPDGNFIGPSGIIVGRGRVLRSRRGWRF